MTNSNGANLPPTLHTVTKQEAAYYAALPLVARIDEDLTLGIRHYRNRAGELLEKFDQVILAILDNDLLVPDEIQLEMAA